MSAPADPRELRRAVWRHEYGRLPSGRPAVDALNDEYQRALDEMHALEGDASTVRRHAPTQLIDYDGDLRRARRALEEEALGTALNHLLRARERMVAIRELLAAAAAIRRAEEPVGRIWDAARVHRLRQMPCVDAPVRLLALARERLREGNWARAAYLAAAAHRQAAPLQPGAPAEPASAGALRSSLWEMRTLCDATRALLANPSADLGGDGTLEAAVALVDDGFVALGERVTRELGALLGPRARFRDALAEEGGRAAERIAELRPALGDPPPADPWGAATQLLWRTRVDEGLRRIAGEQTWLEPGTADDSIFQPEKA